MNETLASSSPLPPTRPKPAWARDLPDVTEKGDPILYGPRPLAPRVVRVDPLENCVLRVTFATGETRRVDCRPLMDEGVFQVLKEGDAFRHVEPINEGGGVGWASGVDLSRDTLYAMGEAE